MCRIFFMMRSCFPVLFAIFVNEIHCSMKTTFLFLISILMACRAFALDPRNPLMAEPQDTVRVQQIIDRLAASGQPLGERVAMAALEFDGTPEGDYYTTDSVAALRIDTGSMTPLMLVNNAVALAKASLASGRPGWRDFVAELQSVACRRGEDLGFPSIMYHTSDWIGDNVFRGNLRELTENFSGVVARTKSLDEMTRYRSRFAALADSAAFETVRMTEMGYRSHRVPALKRETIGKKEVEQSLRDGDILILVPNRDGIDFYDIGVVVMRADGPHLVHLSPFTRRVEEESDVLSRYFKFAAKHFQGYRIVRIRN